MKPINATCTRLTGKGAPCSRPALGESLADGLWLAMLRSCSGHLTVEEKAQRAANEAAYQQRSWEVRQRDPACWSWDVPTDPYAPSAERCELFAMSGGLDPVMDDGTALGEWQDDRCGICGKGRGSLLDHDHRTGLSRGWLCRRCNGGEGFADDPTDVFARWRARPAAAVLGVSFRYSGRGPAQVDNHEEWIDHRYLPVGAPPDRTETREWDGAMRAVDAARDLSWQDSPADGLTGAAEGEDGQARPR